MDMCGEYRIAASRQAVWEALNVPAILKASIPGCEELEQDTADAFTAKVRAKVGPVSARFSGKVKIVDPDPPNGYRIEGEGTGGAAGFAKGGATIELVEDGGQTILRYEANASVGGKLAQIGSRLIDGTAKKMADDFFAKFSANVAEKVALSEEVLTGETRILGTLGDGESVAGNIPDAVLHAAEDVVDASADAVHETIDAAESTAKSMPLWLWIAGAGVILFGLLVLLS